MNRREVKAIKKRLWIHDYRKYIVLIIITICLVASLSIVVNSFLSSAQSNVEDMKYKYYKSVVVKSGDTLWSIANEYMGTEYKDANEYVIEVQKMNGLKDDNITAGNYLIIPYFSNQFII